MRSGRHVGWLAERCRYNRRERVFAEEWRRENRRENRNDWTWLSLLQKLFLRNPESVFGFARPRIVISRREEYIVATVIQWLGTNVGWCFLNTCVERCGYRIVREDREVGKEYEGNFSDGTRDASEWYNACTQKAEQIPVRYVKRPWVKKHYRQRVEYGHLRCGWCGAEERASAFMAEQRSMPRICPGLSNPEPIQSPVTEAATYPELETENL